MTWFPSHPGGIVVCDAPTCNRKRRYYCPPSERDEWVARTVGTGIVDLCHIHRDTKDSAHA